MCGIANDLAKMPTIEMNKYDTAVLATLAVGPEWRSKHLGSKLVDYGLKHAKTHGYKKAIMFIVNEKVYQSFKKYNCEINYSIDMREYTVQRNGSSVYPLRDITKSKNGLMTMLIKMLEFV